MFQVPLPVLDHPTNWIINRAIDCNYIVFFFIYTNIYVLKPMSDLGLKRPMG